MLERSAIVLSLTLCFGCGGDAGHLDGPIERDSAGIRIVEYPVGWKAPQWTLSPKPTVVIGSQATDSSELLFQVEGALRLSDGKIVVANRGTHELRYYDAQGQLVESVGRFGSGPAEFEYIAWIQRCGSDSIYAYDIAHRRFSLFDPAADFVRTGTLLLPGEVTPYGPGTCTDDATFLLAGFPGGRPQPRAHRPDQPIALVRENNDSVGYLGEFPGADRWGTVVDGRLRGSMPHPFGRSLVHTLLDSLAIIGTGETYELQGFALDGSLRLLIRKHRANPELTTTDIERFVAAELADARSDNARRNAERFWTDMEFPHSLPAYSAALTDRDSRLWVRDYPRPNAETVQWSIFDASGLQLGAISIPTDLRVTDVGSDYLIAVVRDDVDVEYVHVYELNRAM